MTQLETNIRIAQEKALEQADDEFLAVGEDYFEEEYSMEPPPEPDRPGEDEWEPCEERDRGKKGKAKAVRRRGRPSKAEFKT